MATSDPEPEESTHPLSRYPREAETLSLLTNVIVPTEEAGSLAFFPVLTFHQELRGRTHVHIVNLGSFESEEIAKQAVHNLTVELCDLIRKFNDTYKPSHQSADMTIVTEAVYDRVMATLEEAFAGEDEETIHWTSYPNVLPRLERDAQTLIDSIAGNSVAISDVKEFLNRVRTTTTLRPASLLTAIADLSHQLDAIAVADPESFALKSLYLIFVHHALENIRDADPTLRQESNTQISAVASRHKEDAIRLGTESALVRRMLLSLLYSDVPSFSMHNSEAIPIARSLVSKDVALAIDAFEYFNLYSGRAGNYYERLATLDFQMHCANLIRENADSPELDVLSLKAYETAAALSIVNEQYEAAQDYRQKGLAAFETFESMLIHAPAPVRQAWHSACGEVATALLRMADGYAVQKDWTGAHSLLERLNHSTVAAVAETDCSTLMALCARFAGQR